MNRHEKRATAARRRQREGTAQSREVARFVQRCRRHDTSALLLLRIPASGPPEFVQRGSLAQVVSACNLLAQMAAQRFGDVISNAYQPDEAEPLDAELP